MSGGGKDRDDFIGFIAGAVLAAAAFGAWVAPNADEWRDAAVERGEHAAGTARDWLAERDILFHPAAPPAGSADAADLAEVRVGPAGSMAGYDRDLFGEWGDPDRNGCNARQDTLARDMPDEVLRSGSRCVVQSGTLDDPYTGRDIIYSASNPAAVQIDHVVALGYAWRHGAADWSRDRRRLFHDYPANLLAVDGPTNQAKGDDGPAEWQPPGEFRCTYARIWVRVVVAWDLTVTSADRDALAEGLGRCE